MLSSVAPEFTAKNTPLVAPEAIGDFMDMKTSAVQNQRAPWTLRLSSQPARVEPVEVRIDWTESEWFKVWLKLARHEDHGSAPSPSLEQSLALHQEAMC